MADLHYAVLQGAINLVVQKEKISTTHLGLVRTYGQLSFTPKDMQDANKSTVEKWLLTTYGTIQHDK